ncbi:HupE/UreJ family protein [Paenibacillus allorhizosphaerae]|uniref:HupE/UreJ family protein n=1 Tax=Paenibacillus allorhizosphaerae TaxID=2849866 RepID=A0ABN7TWQ8_9BACL|nr:HupE/UreJ family protein [Paenibacillus allorhizosphaerae]CAG7657850.1 hypothetical protein PAECIP111802_06876 [Paenibacillus allorhizosphaerae]
MTMFRRTIVFRLLAGLVLFVGLQAPLAPAHAHTSTIGYSDISISGDTIGYELYLNPEEVAQWKDVRSKGVFVIEAGPAASRDKNQVKWTQDDLMPLVQASLSVKSKDASVVPAISDISIRDKGGMPLLYMNLKYKFPKPVESYEIQYNFFFDELDPLHQSFVTLRTPSETVNKQFDKNNRLAAGRLDASVHASGAEALTAWGWLKMGIEHIWTGIDHLLFITALVLLKQKKRDYLKIVTAFTVGHSVTIALSALDIVNLPMRFVEPVIALSIVYVAVENLWLKKLKWRWMFALLFGFIHGFGFAQVLKGALGEHYLLSLFTFNLGVEVGQIAVLAVLLPFLMLSGRLSWYRGAVYVASGFIAVTGLYWFMERVGLY